MATSKGSLKERLSRYRQIKLNVTGRKSGKAISMPVWFVLEGDTLYLLLVLGSDTQWYKNVLLRTGVPSCSVGPVVLPAVAGVWQMAEST